MTRGPVNHLVKRTDQPDRLFPETYPWSNDPTAPGAWACGCGTTGEGQQAAQAHLTQKARAAFARLDDIQASAVATVSGGAGDGDSLHLLGFSRVWRPHRAVRRRMVPYYDHVGSLAARIDWASLAADVDAGAADDVEDSDLLVLRIAVSLAGVPVALNLSHLWRLPQDDVRHVREALLKQLLLEEDHPT